jgi:N-acylneuraminate cytidylyltransferase
MTPLRSPWTAVIPLRAGSKGLPGKNTRLLAGKPLYRHAVDVALAAGAARVILTTDIPDVLSGALPAGVLTLQRPADLCGDEVPMAPVLVHALQAAACEGTVVLLQATSPMRRATDIQAALDVFATGQHDLVMSVTEADRSVLKWGRIDGDRFVPLSDPAHCFSNRQSLPPVVRPNGAVYVMQAQWFLDRGSFVSERIGVVQMSAESSQDIDTLADFERCEAALAPQNSGNK